MPTFDDFNFGDDSGAVDTDPVPDNDNLDANQSSATDGQQDDVANYPEPGQDDRFEGGEPSEFDVQGNPNEPGAQSDHIIPVSKLKHMADPVASGIREMLGSGTTYPGVRELITLYNSPKEGPREPTLRERLDVIRHSEQDADFYKLTDAYRHSQQDAEFEKLNKAKDGLSLREIIELAKGMPSAYLSPEELDSMWQDFLDTGAWYPPDRLTRAQARRETQKLWSIGEKDIIGRRTLIPEDALTESASDDVIEDTNAAEEVKFGYLLDSVAALVLVPDDIINSMFDDESLIALIQEFNKAEAGRGWIGGFDDFANPTDNPSGIGELFDQLLISGHDAFVNIDNSQDIDGLVASDFLALDQYQDEMDIRDYVGDLTLNSDIIEFQNMGQNVLENFDGVL